MAFAPHATNLTSEDPPLSGTYSQIYVNNRLTGQVFRISPNEVLSYGFCSSECTTVVSVLVSMAMFQATHVLPRHRQAT